MRSKTLLYCMLFIAAFTLKSGLVLSSDFPDLTAKELKSKMDAGEKVFILNPLSDLEFNEGHIPGSINVPLETISSSDRLPSDLNVPIITYCLGPK